MLSLTLVEPVLEFSAEEGELAEQYAETGPAPSHVSGTQTEELT